MTKSNILPRLLTFGVAVIFVLMPFHAFFTTWFGSVLGYEDAIKAWKDMLILLLAVPALYLAFKNEQVRKWLWHDRLVLLIGLYAAYTLLLGWWSYSRGAVNSEALSFGLLSNLRYLGFLMVVSVAAAYNGWLKQNWRKLLLWPASVVVAFGLLQLVLPQDFLSNFGYGKDTIPAVQTVDEKPEYQRIQSTLRGANPLGAYLILIVTALVVVLKRQRIPDVTIIILTVAALSFTYSRSAWLGLLVSIVGLLWLVLRSSRQRELLAIGAVCAALIGAGTVWMLRDNDFVQNAVFHTDESSLSANSSNEDRAKALLNGLDDAIEEPLGRGPGTAGPASVRNDGKGRIAENYFIQLGQEVGLIGLGLFVAINAVVAWRLYLRRKEPLALILLASLAGITFVNLLSHAWTDDTIALLWWGFAALALAPNTIKQQID